MDLVVLVDPGSHLGHFCPEVLGCLYRLVCLECQGALQGRAGSPSRCPSGSDQRDLQLFQALLVTLFLLAFQATHCVQQDPEAQIHQWALDFPELLVLRQALVVPVVQFCPPLVVLWLLVGLACLESQAGPSSLEVLVVLVALNHPFVPPCLSPVVQSLLAGLVVQEDQGDQMHPLFRSLPSLLLVQKYQVVQCCHWNMRMLYTFYFVFLITQSVELATVIRYEYSRVLSEESFEERVFINESLVTPHGIADGRTGVMDVMPFINASSPLHDALMIFAKSSNDTINHTYQRFRECKLNGHQVVHVSERIKHNGIDFLTLEPMKDTWTALDPQAVFLKQQLDRDTVRDMMRLQEACVQLMKDLNRPHSVFKGAAVLTPLLAAVVFFALIFLSFIVSKHRAKGSAQPGGILGSVVHYPAQSSDIAREPTIQPSLSMKASLLSNMP